MKQSGSKLEVSPSSDTGRNKALMDEITELNFTIECMSKELREYEEKAEQVKKLYFKGFFNQSFVFNLCLT